MEIKSLKNKLENEDQIHLAIYNESRNKQAFVTLGLDDLGNRIITDVENSNYDNKYLKTKVLKLFSAPEQLDLSSGFEYVISNVGDNIILDTFPAVFTAGEKVNLIDYVGKFRGFFGGPISCGSPVFNYEQNARFIKPFQDTCEDNSTVNTYHLFEII